MQRCWLASLLLAVSLRCRSLHARDQRDQAFVALRPNTGASPRLVSPFSSARGNVEPLSPPPPPHHPLLDDVVYRTGVVPKYDFSVIQQRASSILLPGSRHAGPRLREETSSIAVGREGATLDDRSSASSLLVRTLDVHVSKLLQKLTGCEYRLLRDDIPPELRVYRKRGASMAWHQDDIRYDPPQLEVVYTVENSSDCATRWKKGASKEEEASVETDPNSALVIAAGGPWHCVTSLKRGRRVIVKLAYVLPGARRINSSSHRRESTRNRGTQATRRGTASSSG